MEKRDRIEEYLNIRNLDDLHRHRRLLSSRIDNEEIMVRYKLGRVWDFLSPSNLLEMGCRAVASHSPAFNIFYKTALYIKTLIIKNRAR